MLLSGDIDTPKHGKSSLYLKKEFFFCNFASLLVETYLILSGDIGTPKPGKSSLYLKMIYFFFCFIIS